jgi:hypothetical protein
MVQVNRQEYRERKVDREKDGKQTQTGRDRLTGSDKQRKGEKGKQEKEKERWRPRKNEVTEPGTQERTVVTYSGDSRTETEGGGK